MSTTSQSPLAEAPAPARPRSLLEPLPALQQPRDMTHRSPSPGLIITSLGGASSSRPGRLTATQSLSSVPTVYSWRSQISTASQDSSDFELPDTRIPTRREVKRLLHRRPRIRASASDLSDYHLSSLVPIEDTSTVSPVPKGPKKLTKADMDEVPLYSKTLARMETMRLT